MHVGSRQTSPTPEPLTDTSFHTCWPHIALVVSRRRSLCAACSRRRQMRGSCWTAAQARGWRKAHCPHCPHHPLPSHPPHPSHRPHRPYRCGCSWCTSFAAQSVGAYPHLTCSRLGRCLFPWGRALHRAGSGQGCGCRCVWNRQRWWEGGRAEGRRRTGGKVGISSPPLLQAGGKVCTGQGQAGAATAGVMDCKQYGGRGETRLFPG